MIQHTRTHVSHADGLEMLSMPEALARAQMSARLGEAQQAGLVRRARLARRLSDRVARAERSLAAARVALAEAL